MQESRGELKDLPQSGSLRVASTLMIQCHNYALGIRVESLTWG